MAVTGTRVPVMGSLPPISLEQILESSALQTRVDRKYVVAPQLLEDLLCGLGPGLRILEIDGRRESEYETIYFETPDFASYFGAARGRRKRFKVRTRTYLDDDRCLLEVKVHGGRGETVKHALAHSSSGRSELTEVGRAFVAEHVALPHGGRELEPVLITRYRRCTLVHGPARVTVDSDLVCTRIGGSDLTLPERVIVETKTSGAASTLDRRLWAAGVRPTALSKYAVGMAGLDPTFPANKWNRTLRRHFGWVPDRSPAEPGSSTGTSLVAQPSDRGERPSR